MDIIYFFIVSIISNIIFTIIFLVLNKSILGLFVPLQKLANKAKKKNFFRVLFICISLVICTVIAFYFSFKNIGVGIIFGVFMALETSIFDTKIDKQVGVPYTVIEIIDDDEFKSLILKGKKIRAIKRYRVLTGLGLQKSIEYVNSVSEQELNK